MKLVPLTKQNGAILRDWRNQNRQYFFDQSYISKGKHERWLDSVLHDSAQYIYLINHDGIDIGCVGISFVENPPEITRVLLGNKAYEGMGVMSLALLQLLHTHNVRKCFLEVLADNKHAIKFYQHNGFKYVSKTKNHYGQIKIKMIKNT